MRWSGRKQRLGMVCVVAICLPAAWLRAQGGDAATVQLGRTYREGEAIGYTMRATNQGHESLIRYEARADGLVKRDAAGHFFEEFDWTKLVRNGEAVEFTPATQQFRQDLSLSPDYKLAVPDLSKVQPVLIGPITDLLTFYADVQLAMKQRELKQVGDHVFLAHGTPNSWADGRHTIFGQDAVDFDITLKGIDPEKHLATLVVRHLPPAQSRLKLPVAWMSGPVESESGQGGQSPNNWAQVQTDGDGGYVAQVGSETFEATIQLSLPSGRIVSAELENPVEVLERDCKDAALAECGAAIRYQIKREIRVEAAAP